MKSKSLENHQTPATCGNRPGPKPRAVRLCVTGNKRARLNPNSDPCCKLPAHVAVLGPNTEGKPKIFVEEILCERRGK